MKKFLLIVTIFLSFLVNVNAENVEERVKVSFYECIDGDTAKFKMNEKIIKVRFLAIDTPETSHPTKGAQAYGKESSSFTCEKLKNSNKIEIEFDKGSDIKDKYDRYLAWVWIDDVLMQDLIISEGFGKVAYIYGDYKYTSLLEEHENIAKNEKIGIWSDEENNVPNNTIINNYIFLLIFIIIIIVLFIYSTKFRNKTIKKIKKKIKKQLDKN